VIRKFLRNYKSRISQQIEKKYTPEIINLACPKTRYSEVKKKKNNLRKYKSRVSMILKTYSEITNLACPKTRYSSATISHKNWLVPSPGKKSISHFFKKKLGRNLNIFRVSQK
jgi:hypothetical protein